MRILKEQLGQHGVALQPGGVLKGVRVPVKVRDYFKTQAEGDTKPLVLDGTDTDKKIAVAYVSIADYRALGQPPRHSSVDSYPLKHIAQHLVAVAKQHGSDGKDGVFLGVFYDPVSTIDLSAEAAEGESWDTTERRLKKRTLAESEDLLRQQAQDFVAWLKEQKAI